MEGLGTEAPMSRCRVHLGGVLLESETENADRV